MDKAVLMPSPLTLVINSPTKGWENELNWYLYGNSE